MWQLGIRELKNGHLSRAIRRARLGEQIIVTDHGVPVARIVAIDASGPPPEVADLVGQGLMEYRAPVWDALALPVEMQPGEKLASDYVLEQRR